MPKATSSKNSPHHYQRLKALIPACVLAIAGCGSANESPSALVQEEAAEPTRGLNAKRLEATLQRAAELPNLRSLIVMRGGKEVTAVSAPH